MKPTPQFIQMIAGFFQNRAKSITPNDITKHNAQACTYYSISQAKFLGNVMQSRTDTYSDQIMIEVEKGANKTIIGTPSSNTVYQKASAIEYGHAGGRGFIHWQATDAEGDRFYIVKLLADDLTTQFKILSADQRVTIMHNVCELPSR